MDEERWSPFSLSGYQGSQSLLGTVTGNSFYIRKRLYHRNDFARRFYGTFQPEGGGTRIEGYFAMPAFARIFLGIWLAGVTGIGGGVFVITLRQVLAGNQPLRSETWVGLIVPPGMALFGIVLARFGRFLGRNNEVFIVEHLQSTLAANIEANPAISAQPIHP
jgi:hypothetical protein